MWVEILNATYDKQAGIIQNRINLNPLQIEELVSLSGESVREVLNKEVSEGNIDQILSLFRGKHETSATHPVSAKIRDVVLDKVKKTGDMPLEKADAAQRMVVPYILTLIKDKLPSDGTVPSSQTLRTLFGGQGTLSEGTEDKIRREWTKGF